MEKILLILRRAIMNRMKNVFVVAWLLGAVVTLSGCVGLLVGAAAGAGGYAWAKGALVKEFDVSAEKLTSAAVRGIKKLELPLEEEKTDHLSGYVRSKTADNQKIVIEVKALTEKRAELRIRVGLLGDLAKSEMLLNAIKKNL